MALNVDENLLPDDQDGLFRIFISSRVMGSIQRAILEKTKDEIEENDIPDANFISITLPYFDIVTVDRKMAARIRDAQIDDIIHGQVVH